MAISRGDPAPLKVIGLGLPRTGVRYLQSQGSFEYARIRPLLSYVQNQARYIPAWCKIGDGFNTPEAFDPILGQYGSVLDYPAAMYPAELYAAYPEAKFILTTRDPDKWEKSMNATILRVARLRAGVPAKSELNQRMQAWNETYMQGKTHHGRLQTHPQQEMAAHNERIKQLIPPEKLLIYEVGEGWGQLGEFLRVPKPDAKFPHVNKAQDYEEAYINNILKELTEDE